MAERRYPTLGKKFRESNSVNAVLKAVGGKLKEDTKKELDKLTTDSKVEGSKPNHDATIQSIWTKMSYACADDIEANLAAIKPAAPAEKETAKV